MNTLTTNGVFIAVETFFKKEYSDFTERIYIFSYKIKIKNLNAFPIQILRRHWIIKDALSNIRQVQGDGIVGIQPIILQDETFEYTSVCDFRTEIGIMRGYYTVINLLDESEFDVEIPTLKLYVPNILN